MQGCGCLVVCVLRAWFHKAEQGDTIRQLSKRAPHIPSPFPSLLQLPWVSMFVPAGFIHSGTERSGVGNGPLPQEPAVSLAQRHRNPPAIGAQAHVYKLLFSQCTHLEHTWFLAMLCLRSCREMEGMAVQGTLRYEGR